MTNCLNCEEETTNPKFCCKSCSATYNNRLKPKRKPRDKPNCLNCGIECKTLVAKFCCQECSAEYKWFNVTVPRIEAGEESIDNSTLRKYLVKVRGDCCEECGVGSSWNNKPLVLQVDHVNGDSDNSSPENIRLLCPNCHTQTETYGSKGQGNRYKKTTRRNKYLQEYKR